MTEEDAGTVSVTSVSGGEGPYMYSLDGDVFVSDTSFGGLTPGFYEVYISDMAGCVIPFDFEIEGPPELFLDLGPDLSIALGETVNLSAIGGGR